MATCNTCNNTILFGGKHDGDRVYCNDQCMARSALSEAGAQVPAETVRREALALRSSACPQCQRTGSPIEYRESHRAISYIIATSWSSPGQLCCRTCHVKALLGNSAITLLAGWWGFPWGLIATPLQLIRNVVGLCSGGDRPEPSEKLLAAVRSMLAQHAPQAGPPSVPPAR